MHGQGSCDAGSMGLSRVPSGKPIILKPLVDMAGYSCEYRNFWLQNVRETGADKRIGAPDGIEPYPRGRESISDRPESDGGNNFGRIARIGLLDEFISELTEPTYRG